jgi:hypothetical protein
MESHQQELRRVAGIVVLLEADALSLRRLSSSARSIGTVPTPIPMAY